MDSGVVLEEETKRPPFRPLTPLLPSELCYILDRTFACEVGVPVEALGHTVY